MLKERLSDWVTEWPSDQVTKWPSDRVTKWPSDRVTEWPNDRVTGWQEASQTIDRMVYLWMTTFKKTLSFLGGLGNWTGDTENKDEFCIARECKIAGRWQMGWQQETLKLRWQNISDSLSWSFRLVLPRSAITDYLQCGVRQTNDIPIFSFSMYLNM